MARVALINMPFATLYRPSIGLSLLKSALERDGHQADLHYLNLEFANRIGDDLYTTICDSIPTALAGEWVFSRALCGTNSELERRYLEQFLPGYYRKGVNAELGNIALKAREQVEAYLEDCLQAVNWAQYDVIGFTSVFQQSAPSLALAKRLKERYPEKLIAMGGANAEGVMGHAILRAFPFVDLVCSGEGDLAFPELIRRLDAGEVLSGVPGITLQHDLYRFGEVGGQPVHDMDALPYPDYDDYFGRLSAQPYYAKVKDEVRFMFESSRGCWWGAKSHCKFCGLNGNGMTFRAKSAKRALAELQHLYERYRPYTQWASAVDNIIEMSYFRDFLPAIRDMGLDLNMFYETKANLTKDQVELFAAAGFNSVQPGIESLSTSILRLMRKGVSALQNIQVLKWCRELGVKPYWNYLTGFPGEDPAEYERVVGVLRAVSHLDPPYGCGQLRLDRFSPYFDDPAGNGVVNVRPYETYKFVFHTVPDDLLFHMAYYFEFDYADGRDLNSYTHELAQTVKQWKESGPSEFFSVGVGDRLVLIDLRSDALQGTHQLQGAARLAYEYCDAIRSRQAIGRHLREQGYDLPEGELSQLLSGLVAKWLMVAENDQYLSLAIPLGRYSPGPSGTERFLQFMAQQGQHAGRETTGDIARALNES